MCSRRRQVVGIGWTPMSEVSLLDAFHPVLPLCRRRFPLCPSALCCRCLRRLSLPAALHYPSSIFSPALPILLYLHLSTRSLFLLSLIPLSPSQLAPAHAPVSPHLFLPPAPASLSHTLSLVPCLRICTPTASAPYSYSYRRFWYVMPCHARCIDPSRPKPPASRRTNDRLSFSTRRLPFEPQLGDRNLEKGGPVKDAKRMLCRLAGQVRGSERMQREGRENKRTKRTSERESRCADLDMCVV